MGKYACAGCSGPLCSIIWKLLNDNPHGLTKTQVIAKEILYQTSETLWELALEVIDESVAKGFT